MLPLLKEINTCKSEIISPRDKYLHEMSNHPIVGIVLLPLDHFLVSLRDAIVVSFVREKKIVNSRMAVFRVSGIAYSAPDF